MQFTKYLVRLMLFLGNKKRSMLSWQLHLDTVVMRPFCSLECQRLHACCSPLTTQSIQIFFLGRKSDPKCKELFIFPCWFWYVFSGYLFAINMKF